jgi:hypothetical protein
MGESARSDSVGVSQPQSSGAVDVSCRCGVLGLYRDGHRWFCAGCWDKVAADLAFRARAKQFARLGNVCHSYR